MNWSNRTVLVTGGAGFIGSAVVRELVAKGADVHVVDNLLPHGGGNRHNLSTVADRIEIHDFDLANGAQLQPLVDAAEVIFNLAGQTSHLRSMGDPFEDLDANVRSQLALLECCRRASSAPRVIFTSTRQVYGRPENLPVNETHPLRPVDINGIHKLAAEQYHRLYHDVYGIQYCALRLTNTYGPGMRIKDAQQNFLGEWIRRLLRNETIEVWGGMQKRDFNHVDDVVSALLLVAERDDIAGEVFNLGNSEVVALAELADRMIRLAGEGRVDVLPFPETHRAIDIGSYAGDFQRLAGYGWSPRVDLDQGLLETIDYFRRHGDQYL